MTAIPLSLLAAVIGLQQFGVSLNTLTLGGLAIAIGIVVDDAIIDVENVWRRVRLSREQAPSPPAFHVVRDAVLEVRSPVVYATFVVVLIFKLMQLGPADDPVKVLGVPKAITLTPWIGIRLRCAPRAAQHCTETLPDLSTDCP